MEFALPEIGEGVYEAELVRWLVEAGATIKRGQPLAEVMTDKATMEVPSPFVGTVTALLAQPGQQIKIGQPLLSYESSTLAAQPVAVVSTSKSAATAASASVPKPMVNGP